MSLTQEIYRSHCQAIRKETKKNLFSESLKRDSNCIDNSFKNMSYSLILKAHEHMDSFDFSHTLLLTLSCRRLKPFAGWHIYKNALIPRNKASRLKQNSGGFWFLMIWKGITVFSEYWVQCFFGAKRYFSGIMVQRLIYRLVCFKIFCDQVFQCSSVRRRDGPVNEKDSKLKH